ncbi:MAG TPA: hypothetical protein VE889_08140 [Actinomycetota bacterium]|jgi:hypothetical protein|nr:hypothetical protein [Actinomycetota bacterium]
MGSASGIWSDFLRRSGVGETAAFREVLEAVRRIPYGRPADRTVEGVIREWRGTCSTKHDLLAVFADERWPLDIRIMHRVYNLTPAIARRLFGEEAATVVPADGVMDVHTYMTAIVDGRRVVIDVTVPGAPRDGHSDMGLACGNGTDIDGGTDPRRTKERLVRQYCDALARDRVIESIGRAATQLGL